MRSLSTVKITFPFASTIINRIKLQDLFFHFLSIESHESHLIPWLDLSTIIKYFLINSLFFALLAREIFALNKKIFSLLTLRLTFASTNGVRKKFLISCDLLSFCHHFHSLSWLAFIPFSCNSTIFFDGTSEEIFSCLHFN